MTREEFYIEIERLGLSITKDQKETLEKFYQLLVQTNKTMNLTRITALEEVYLKHFYDSLTIAKIYDLKEANTLCDIGSGAGFPGIVLKIFFPHLQITLIDALQKRITYLENVIETLGLEGIEARHLRAEQLQQENETFDIVTARAVAALPKLIDWAMPLVKPNGYFIAMKGNVEEELEKTKPILKKNAWELEKKLVFLLPKEDSKRTLLLIKRQS